MIEQVIDGIVDEISLEGREGCTFDQLFLFAESLITKSIKDAILQRPICFDDNYKSYLWTHLRNMDQLLFVLNGNSVDYSALSYTEMKEMATSKELRVKTTEESQDQSIYGTLRSVKKSLTDNHKILLYEIAKSRSQGISQFQLGEKLKMESKVVFYYIKKLDNLGLIVKESAYADTMNTRIIFLRRFAKQNDESEEEMDSDLYRIGTFKSNLIKQLSSAENKMMTLQDAIKSMGFVTHRNIRWARVKIAQLHDEGVVEKINAFHGRIYRPSVRLCQNNMDASKAVEEEESQMVTNELEGESSRHETFYRDLPGEYQFYRDIVSSGERGLVRQELIDKYPYIDPQIYKTFLDNVASAPKNEELLKLAVYRSEELDGKNRLFRYFDCAGWKRFNESIGKEVIESHSKTPVKKPVLVEPTEINQIGKSFGLLPRTKMPVSRLKSNNKEVDPESPAKETDDKSRTKRRRTNDTTNNAKEGHSAIKRIESQVAEGSRTRKSRRTELVNEETQSANKRKIDTGEEGSDIGPTSSENQVNNHQANYVEIVLNRPQSKRAKGNKTSTLNSTKVRRCNILLKMMEEQHIRELNTETANEFNEIEKEAAGGQKMAVTTFNKMAKQLHEEKKLKIYVTSIQKQFGFNEIKTFLLHPSISEDGEEMKQVIDSYIMEKPLMNRKAKRKEFRNVIVEMAPTSETPKDTPIKKSERASMDSTILALEYGWMKSKWHRSKALHESLVEYYTSSENDDNIIDIIKYIKSMSLDTLISIVSSLPYEDKDFRSFVDVEENRQISLGDVPEKIRLLIFQSRLRIRFLINQFLQVLEALEVVKAMDKADTAIAPHYYLNDQGVIRDYAFKDRAVVKTLPLRSVEDVRNFWEQLQTTCVHPARPRTENDEIELEKVVDKGDPLYHIHRSRGWVVEVVLTSKQKEILDSYIDETTTTIPSDNAALRIYLMKKTKLTAKRIRAYYAGVMSAILQKQSKEEKTRIKLQKQLAISSNSTINDLMLASTEKRKVDTAVDNMKQESPFILPTYIGSRRVRRLRVRTEPLKGQDHDTRDYKSSSNQNPDTLEKDLLLYAYCIMKVRAKVGTFFWDPATMIMSGKSKHQCRRIINGMKSKEPGLIIKIKELMEKWEKFYKEGIQSQKIKDENPWNTLEFDLPSHVEYFLIRLKEESEYYTNTKYKLPLEIKKLHDNYKIVHSDPEVVQARKQTNNYSVTLGLYDENEYDIQCRVFTKSSETCQVHLVKTLIKMLLMTPDNLYDSEAAFRLFNIYPHALIEEAVKSLKEEGLVIIDKSKYGRVPGRAINVSEKFLKIAEGTFPHGLIDEARNHLNFVANTEVLKLNRGLVNSGVVASTLSLLSQKKITLFVTQTDAYEKFNESHYYPKASAVSLQRKFIYKNLEIAIKKDVPDPLIDDDTHMPEIDSKLSATTTEQINSFIQRMEEKLPLVRTVYEAVNSSASQGLSIPSIEQYVIANSLARVDTDQIRNTLHELVHHNPPLIHIIGFEDLRYISLENISSWLLKTDLDKTFLYPLMWNDVSGNVIPLALEGCANAVISHILAKPGISHANLRKTFESFFTEFELYTLLKYLVKSKIVTVRKIAKSSRPARVTIFDKRASIKVAKNDMLINSDEISHYWISENYYLLKRK